MTEERRTKRPARWETLARFEGRVTDRQLTKLKSMQRKLSTGNRQAKVADPSVQTERITDNTLIRVALELLFAFEPDITGHTERELIDSAKAAIAQLRQAGEQLHDLANDQLEQHHHDLANDQLEQHHHDQLEQHHHDQANDQLEQHHHDQANDQLEQHHHDQHPGL